MDSPDPDSGEEHSHTNTQLFNILSDENRFKLGADVTAPWNAPEPGQVPTMEQPTGHHDALARQVSHTTRISRAVWIHTTATTHGGPT
jgi:hypothetical protein